MSSSSDESPHESASNMYIDEPTVTAIRYPVNSININSRIPSTQTSYMESIEINSIDKINKLIDIQEPICIDNIDELNEVLLSQDNQIYSTDFDHLRYTHIIEKMTTIEPLSKSSSYVDNEHTYPTKPPYKINLEKIKIEKLFSVDNISCYKLSNNSEMHLEPAPLNYTDSISNDIAPAIIDHSLNWGIESASLYDIHGFPEEQANDLLDNLLPLRLDLDISFFENL